VRQRYRRQLSRIERNLAEDAPALKSMFAMFNQLSAGERPVTVERVPARAWSSPEWRRPPAFVAVLLALAAIVALCLTLSTKVHTVVRPCAATAATAATAVAPPAGAQVRGLNCPAYANK
jgi:ferric-dicitrate binding protein FerR (iron transport regulator)